MKSLHQAVFDELVVYALKWKIVQNFRNTFIKMGRITNEIIIKQLIVMVEHL